MPPEQHLSRRTAVNENDARMFAAAARCKELTVNQPPIGGTKRDFNRRDELRRGKVGRQQVGVEHALRAVLQQRHHQRLLRGSAVECVRAAGKRDGERFAAGARHELRGRAGVDVDAERVAAVVVARCRAGVRRVDD